MNGQWYTFRTPNLLVRGYQRKGEMCFDSTITLLASSYKEAERKKESYIAYGKKIGWYK